MANQFYSDPSLYWIIASANPDSVQPDSLYLRGGIQLRIPSDVSGIITRYNINNSRGSSQQSSPNRTTTSVSSVGGGGGGY